MVGIPDYQPSIGYPLHCPHVSAKGVSLVYSGGDSHQGLWSFDLQRSERLTPPPSRTFARFPDSSLVSDFFFHSVPFIVPVWPHGHYLLKVDRAYSWMSVDHRAIISAQNTCRPPGRGSISLSKPLIPRLGPTGPTMAPA